MGQLGASVVNKLAASLCVDAAVIVAAISGVLLIAGVSMIHRGRRLSQATGVDATAPPDMRSKFKLVLIAFRRHDKPRRLMPAAGIRCLSGNPMVDPIVI